MLNEEEVDKTILIIGSTGTGKTSSLRNLDLSKTVYINVDEKMLPFRSKDLYKQVKLKNTQQLLNGMEATEEDPQVDFVVVDTLTFLGDMYFAEHIENASNTMAGWGNYKSYILKVLNAAKKSKKHYIFLCHDLDVYDEKEMVTKTFGKIQGSLKGGGLEQHFTFVLYTQVVKGDGGMPKYVFQTNKAVGNIGVSAKTPFGIFEEPYTDTNDLVEVYKQIDEFYNEGS